MVGDSNNNIEGFKRLLKNIHVDSCMFNLILPFETCQHLLKRCSESKKYEIYFLLSDVYQGLVVILLP